MNNARQEALRPQETAPLSPAKAAIQKEQGSVWKMIRQAFGAKQEQPAIQADSSGTHPAAVRVDVVHAGTQLEFGEWSTYADSKSISVFKKGREMGSRKFSAGVLHDTREKQTAQEKVNAAFQRIADLWEYAKTRDIPGFENTMKLMLDPKEPATASEVLLYLGKVEAQLRANMELEQGQQHLQKEIDRKVTRKAEKLWGVSEAKEQPDYGAVLGRPLSAKRKKVS